jgi:peroxiredoxin
MARLRLAMLAVLALFAVVTHAGDLRVGGPAPRLDTKLADGRILPARQLEGKVVLQYFWATWCPICRDHLPHLQKLYEAYQPRGLEIIAQSLDDDPSVVVEFWRKGGYTFPVAMRSDETRAGFGPITGTPTLFLIDRRGTVRLKRLGTLPDGALEAQINALLK